MWRQVSLWLGVGAVTALPAAAPQALPARIDAHVARDAPALVDLRRDLHRHPELSGQESRTAEVIAGAFRALGLDVTTGVGGHGVVGLLRGGRPGPLVAYRADMDAVRSTAPDPVEFASVVPGVRHICGHDLHMTVAIGLARALAAVRDDLAGRVVFVFQPAEERATGARAMLDAGLFDRERPAVIFGLHTAPFASGLISSTAGRMMHANAIAPGVVNDELWFRRARSALVAHLGEAAYVDLTEPPPGFSEDFGEFQKVVPGVFFFLGASNDARGLRAMPHDPMFVIDEAAIPFGVRAMAAVVLDALTAPGRPPRSAR